MSKKVWANALLSDGKILFWWTGSECKTIYDFYKDFYYANINFLDYEKRHKLEVVKTMFEENIPEDNEKIFVVLAKEFYRKYEISPDSKGNKPYEKEHENGRR